MNKIAMIYGYVSGAIVIVVFLYVCSVFLRIRNDERKRRSRARGFVDKFTSN